MGTTPQPAPSIRVEQDRSIRRLTLAAPSRKNVFDVTVAARFVEEIAAGQADPETRVILIDAEGPVFCGGMEAGEQLPPDFYRFGKNASKPIIVSVQGVAVSVGVAILANAHIVVAAQGSSFGLTDIRAGLCPDEVLDAVAEAVGWRRTRELALTGRVFTTPEALSWGLVHHATPAFELEDRVLGVAEGLAKADAAALRRTLRSR